MALKQKKGATPPVEILLVEDDPINQMVTTELLTRWGFSVTVAQHGKEALEVITRKNFRVVIMDIQMPEMDGCEVTRRIREMKDAYFKTVPIIAYTASALADTKEKAVELGMDDYISKPLIPQVLQAKVEMYAGRQTGPYRLKVDFDQYDEGDKIFKGKLIRLMADNLAELKGAALEAGKKHDFQLFSQACNKVSPTIIMLNDPGLESAVEEVKASLKRKTGRMILHKKIHRLEEMCEHITVSLKTEMEMTLRQVAGFHNPCDDSHKPPGRKASASC